MKVYVSLRISRSKNFFSFKEKLMAVCNNNKLFLGKPGTPITVYTLKYLTSITSRFKVDVNEVIQRSVTECLSEWVAHRSLSKHIKARSLCVQLSENTLLESVIFL